MHRWNQKFKNPFHSKILSNVLQYYYNYPHVFTSNIYLNKQNPSLDNHIL